MPIEPDVERQILFRSGNCNFTSMAEDFVFNGITYEPGIIVAGEHSPSVDGKLGLVPKACEDIITDRNLGDSVYVDLIQRYTDYDGGKIREVDWHTTSTHWYILGSVNNQGRGSWEIRLLSPKSILNKGELLYWSDEFTKRKYNDDPWFEKLSNIREETFKIRIG